MSQNLFKKFKIGFCACILAGGIITVSPASYAQEQSNLVAPAPNQVDVIPVVSNNDAYAFESDDVTHPPLRLTPDKSTLIRLPRAAGSIIVGNPNHLNILPDSSLTLVAVPRMPGASFFTVLDKDGEVVMQRHVIVASPSKKYVRIRRTCNGDAAGCQDTSVYYCPDMCHEIQMNVEPNETSTDASAEASSSGSNLGESLAQELNSNQAQTSLENGQ